MNVPLPGESLVSAKQNTNKKKLSYFEILCILVSLHLMLLFCKVAALVEKANQSQPIFTVKAQNPKNHKNHKFYL